MKKDLYKGISTLSDIINPQVEVRLIKRFDFLDENLKNILDEIFSVDERTGLPKGDIQYYLSADGNPQVKEWLELNLLQPRAVAKGSSLEGVTDDLIAEMTKGKNESVEDYVARLASIRDEVLDKPLNE